MTVEKRIRLKVLEICCRYRMARADVRLRSDSKAVFGFGPGHAAELLRRRTNESLMKNAVIAISILKHTQFRLVL